MAALGFAIALIAAGLGEHPLSVLGRHELTCPICRQVFTTVACVQSNKRCGVDRDLFARALGPQPEFYRISTCPRCGYSGYTSDFDPGVEPPPDVREKILRELPSRLPEGFTPASDPRELDAADRYALAVTCYRWQQKSDEARAWLHLRASWVAREKGSTLPPEPRLQRVMAYIERYRPAAAAAENQADVEMQTATRVAEALATGQFNRYQQPYVELALALMLRRHGENRHAAPMLDRLAGCQRFSESLREGIERMRASIPREREHQLESAGCFERALLAEQIRPPNRGPACYLLAELYRRLGRDADAIRWYDKALSDPALPTDLREWARQQRAWSASQ